MRITGIASSVAICAGAMFVPGLSPAATYTWEPTDGKWDTTTGNWNDGTSSGVLWVDDTASPNDAVFGASAARKTVSVGSTRYVNNLNVGEDYTFNGADPISVAGTVTLTGTGGSTFNSPFASLRADGSLHIAAASDWKIGYFGGANTQSATYLEGLVYFAPGSDAVFGPVPDEPTDNILVTGTPTIYGNAQVSMHSNRTIRISSGSGLLTGGTAQLTYGNQIVAEPDEGSKWSSDTFVTIRSDWTSLITFDPGAARTNAFGRLRTYSRLKLASGVTAVTGPSGGTGASAVLYVKGNESSFSATHGNLLIDGGELYAPQSSRFVDVRQYGQVAVTNSGKVYMPNVEWLNGLYTPGRLTIADGGEVTLDKLRISQCSYAQSEIHLEEGGILRANSICINESEAQKVLFRFNGGAVQARNASIEFITNPNTARYGKARFAVGEKGAVFDTSNGIPFRWSRPLVSDAKADGGVRKFGSGTLVFTTTNAYNGATFIESGMLQVRKDRGLPSDTTLRLSGNGALDCYTGDSESPARATTNYLARVEGSGRITHSANLHVSGSVAPSAGGTISISDVCDLGGDLEITGNEGQCGCVRFESAGQNISGLRVTVVNADALERETPHRILDAPNGYTGKFDESALPAGWKVRYASDGAKIRYAKGLMVIFR
ncbi:MAG: hypothetical protein K6G91_04405 [Kiritimatiellae bacterium]|nr:hypothetical protein [Kiritimatiellia bacterium]